MLPKRSWLFRRGWPQYHWGLGAFRFVAGIVLLLAVCAPALAGGPGPSKARLEPIGAQHRTLGSAALPEGHADVASLWLVSTQLPLRSVRTSSYPNAPAAGPGVQPTGMAPRPAASPLVQAVTYEWVNNQGASPPISYQWVEISSTGRLVDPGSSYYEEVDLGFPFAFYGITYTTLYVSSSGFVTFGSGDTSLYNDSIPSAMTPNNAIYAFWDDLIPMGGDYGDVYVQQVAADRYVVQWNQVQRLSTGDRETFEIILNGADGTILLQYQSVAGADSCTVGVENDNGTGAVQYAYDSAGVIVDGLAVRFTPAHVLVPSISGTVRDYDGAPLSGVTVSITEGPVIASDYTGADGTYTLLVITGTYTLRAEKYYDGRDPPAQTVTVPPDHSDVNFTFPARYTINGVVRHDHGSPLSGVQVSTSSGPLYAYDVTHVNGAYTLTVISGTYTLQASKSGLVGPPTQTVTVPPSRSDVDFAFPARYTISGVVRDSDGSPLSGARVSASGGPLYAYDNTTANGAYTLTVISGTYTLQASKSGLVSPPARTVTVPPDRSDVDFAFPARYTISGVVRDGNDSPLSGVQVSASGPISASDSTDAGGIYTLTVISGTYTVQASKSGLVSPPAQTVTVPPNRTGIDFRLVPEVQQKRFYLPLVLHVHTRTSG